MPAIPDHQPDHQRVFDDIVHKIESGEWPPGHRLPSAAKLAATYQVGRNTMDLVFVRLRDAGLVKSHQGKGRWVADRAAG